MQRSLWSVMVVAAVVVFSAALVGVGVLSPSRAWGVDAPEKDKSVSHEGVLVEAGNSKLKVLEGGKEVVYDVSPDAVIRFEGTIVNLERLPIDRPLTLVVTEPKDKAGKVVIKADMPVLWYRTGMMQLLIATLVLVVPFFIGSRVARALRMSDHGWRVGVVLFAAVAGVVMTAMNWPPSLGIDLQGGVNMVYEVDRAKLQESKDTVDMKKMVDAIILRVNKGGQKEVVVRTYGSEQIEVVVPNTTRAEIEELKKIISSAGALEFRILADSRKHSREIQLANNLPDPRHTQVKDSANNMVAKWVKLDDQKFPAGSHAGMITRQRAGHTEVLVKVEDEARTVTGGDLSYASHTFDQHGGPAVGFGFGSAGALKFGELTGTHLPDPVSGPYRLGIVLDDVLLSAPNINSRISGQGIIEGKFTEAEVNSLIQILQAGKLPATLKPDPVSERMIDPLLGEDTIRKAKMAMLISCIAVPLFMVFYYRFLGVISTLTTILNMLLVVGFMLAIHAALTLTGLAALALTVGMAVDASVLIFERMREEAARGASLRMVIRNAFDRALSTIIDSNLTTLIAATVLYVIGTDQVKGFAVALWLGVSLNIFTATFCNRVLFDVAEKVGLLKQIKMMHLFGVTNFDFMSVQRWAIGGTVLLNIVGLIAFASLGKKAFDIDFTGGSSVEVLFKKEFAKPDQQALTSALPGLKDKDLSAIGTRLGDEAAGIRWRIITSEQNVKLVQEEIKKAFPNQLEVLHVKLEDVKEIAMAEPKADKPGPFMPIPGTKPDPSLEPNKPPADDSKEPAKPEEKPGKAEEPATDKKQTSRSVSPALLLGSLSLQSLVLADGDQPEAAKTGDAKAIPETSPFFPPLTGDDPFAGGTQAKLVLSQKRSLFDVQKFFTNALTAAGLKEEFAKVRYDISNPAHDGFSQQPFGVWDVKIAASVEKSQKLLDQVQKIAEEPSFPNSDSFGPQVAGKTQSQTIVALVASWALIIIYVWFRFQRVAYGLAAVLALIHDVFITIGFMAFAHYLNMFLPALGSLLLVQDFKVNLTIVAAILTIIGYSVNDTIVVFDRIREVKGKAPFVTDKIVNDSINQTLSRTILTAFTVFMVAFILYVFGGEGVRAFSFCMLVGVFTGCFSSIYVAAPMLVWFERLGRTQSEKAYMATHGVARPVA